MTSSVESVAPATPPGPRTWVPGGNYWAFRRDGLAFFTGLQRTYGDFVAFRFGRQKVYLVSRPEWIEDILVTSAGKFAKGLALDRARRLLGNGLLTANGADHLRQRRIMQPLFHKQWVQGLGDAMVRHATRWADTVTPGQTLNVTDHMGGLALAIVGETLFSSDVQRDVDEVREALGDAVQGFTLAFLPFVGALENTPLPPFVRMRKARERLDGIIRRIVAERRKDLEIDGAKAPSLQAPSLQSPSPQAPSLHPSLHKDLVTMLLAARDPENPRAVGMSDEQIRDEAMTIFLAGHETTANAMAWTWYLLSKAPEAELRLHAELKAVLGGRVPTADDVPKLEWTRAIVAESMRLQPPAWTMGRRALEPHEVGGHRIEAGALVIMSQYVVHRDPRWWPEADRFMPERWINPAGARHKFTYFPFGGGARVCIGEAFAWTEAILLLATIAQRFRFVDAGAPPPVPEPRITLRPVNLLLRAEPR